MEIGSFSPMGDSAYGVGEMYGNIREWTSSIYKPYPYDPRSDHGNSIAENGIVVRGKSWERLKTMGRSKIIPSAGPMPVSFYRFRCAFSF
jgi:formylglycine-generating enzyme required for sulfatase activity